MVFGSLYETVLARRQARIDARQRHAVKSNNNEDIHDLKIRSHLNNVMLPVMDDKEQLKISDSDISGEDETITGKLETFFFRRMSQAVIIKMICSTLYYRDKIWYWTFLRIQKFKTAIVHNTY